MKSTFIILTALFMFSIVLLSAHPASSVAAGFNKDENLLTINFKHQVRDNVDHFISDLVVRKNKKVIITQKLGTQDTLEGGILTYKINDLKPKDKLTITTRCNKTGNKSVTIENK